MEKERLKFCIERFDSYYDSVNNKSSVFLAVSIFIVGGLVASYPSILNLVNCGLCVHLIMISAIGLGLATMIIVIMASTPFLTNDSDSLYYFGSIACLTQDQFCVKSGPNFTDEDELSDLRNQVHQLSRGLKMKFTRLTIVGMLFTIQFYLFIPLILIIAFNLK